MLSYGLLFACCALKSGALPLFAGFAAQAGALDVAWVAAATFAGGYGGDEARFFVARRYGINAIASRALNQPINAGHSSVGAERLLRPGLFATVQTDRSRA